AIVLLIVLVMTMGMMIACRPADEEEGGIVSGNAPGVNQTPGAGTEDNNDTPGSSAEGTQDDPGSSTPGTSGGTTNQSGNNNQGNGNTNQGGSNPSGNTGSGTGDSGIVVKNPLVAANKTYNNNAALSYDLDAIGFTKGKLADMKGKTLTLYTGSDNPRFSYYNTSNQSVDEFSWYKEVKRLYGVTIKYVRCSTGGANVLKPFQAMSAGKDIDLITIHGSSIPYICNTLAPLEPYCNFDKFEDNPGLDPLITKYTTWKGKKIILGPNGHSDVLNYNRTLIKNAGLPDPYEQFKKGEWDWTAFKQLMTGLPETDASGKKVYGYVTSGCWWVWPNTNGLSAFEIDNNDPNGNIKNNFDSAEVKEAFIWLESVADAGGAFYNGDGYSMLYGTHKTAVCAMFSSNGGLDLAAAGSATLNNDYFWVPFPKNAKNKNGINQVEVPGDGIGIPRKTNNESNRTAAVVFMNLWVNRFTESEFDNLRHVSKWTHEQVVEYYNYGQVYGRMGIGAGLGELQKKGGTPTRFFESIYSSSHNTATCMAKLSNYAKTEVENVLKFGIQ
ncbi:MAG: carbohydrate ABC transporter substrate-binding protein, partial [Clostridia bacterium]|nr:carbohydrate ABC transporter substrate-binding protein [Clostridia bacterium]